MLKKKLSYDFSELVNEMTNGDREYRLDRTHQNYDILTPKWDDLYNCYIGGGAIQNAPNDKYLIKRANEPSKKYAIRKREAIYYNKCFQVVSIFQGYIWHREPIRILPKQLEDFKNNVDGKGTSVNKFFSFITKMAQVFGVYYVLVDYSVNPDISEIDKQSKEDEERLGLRPYFCSIDPRDILNWKEGVSGLEWVVIREIKTIEKTPFLPPTRRVQYRLITPDKQYIYYYEKDDKDNDVAVLLDERDISVGEVTLVPFYSEKISQGVGKAAISDIADLSLELYNKHSARQHTESMSAFPLLFLKNFNKDEPIVVSEDYALIGDENSDAKYTEISGAAMTALRDAEVAINDEIFDLALKQVRPKGSAPQTAEAKKLDRLDALSDIQTRAIGFSNSEEQCWEYWAKWINLTNPEIEVSYNLDYNLQSMTPELLKAFIELKNQGLLSNETILKTISQGEIMPRSFDPIEELEKIKEQKETIKIVPENND
jgi:hypothetical protein